MNINNYSQEMISNIVKILDKIAITNSNNPDSKNHVTDFFNLTAEELETVVKYVVETLPQRLYLDKYENVKDYVQEFIAKELILFLVQEDKRSPEFLNNIKNFKDEIMDEIVNNIYVADQ